MDNDSGLLSLSDESGQSAENCVPGVGGRIARVLEQMAKIRPPRAHERRRDLLGSNGGESSRVDALDVLRDLADVRQDDCSREDEARKSDSSKAFEDGFGRVSGDLLAEKLEPFQLERFDLVQLVDVETDVELQIFGVVPVGRRLTGASEHDGEGTASILVDALLEDSGRAVKRGVGVDELDGLRNPRQHVRSREIVGDAKNRKLNAGN